MSPLIEELVAIGKKAQDQWSEAESQTVFDYFIEREYLETSPEIRKIKSEIAATQGKASALKSAAPTTMVMVQKSEPNPAFILMRGDFQRLENRSNRMFLRSFPDAGCTAPKSIGAGTG